MRRPAWYGLLCLVIITTAAASVLLIHMQSGDTYADEYTGNFVLIDGSESYPCDTFEEIMDIINNGTTGPVLTIIVNVYANVSGFTFSANKDVTLMSPSGEPFVLMSAGWRHFTVVNGSLTLENIILDGKNSGGGIDVYSAGTLIMGNGAVIQNCYSDFGGGVSNMGEFTMKNGATIQNCSANLVGGGVLNNYGTFTMEGGAVVQNFSHGIGGGGVYNSAATFVMNGGMISGNKVCDINGNIIGNGGGVYNNCIFTMNGGTISNNTANNGGGVCNYFEYNTKTYFTMNGGMINNNKATSFGGGVSNYYMTESVIKGGDIISNTAALGGGVYNAILSTLNITGGNIIGNTATGSDDARGSGGGIFSDDYANLTVGDGVVFSGNTAPTLRTENIDPNADIDGNGIFDLDDYKNIGNVKLDAWVSGPVNKNAPAYNNFDINYPGDAYVVYIFIKPNGGGTVIVTDNGGGNGPMVLAAYEWLYVPAATASTLTLSAEPGDGYELKQLIDGITKAIIDSQADVPISGNMVVVAEFKQKEYTISAESDSGSAIDPSGAVNVLYGENKTFTFSAKPGHKITAVYVDGNAISSKELASGKYTFTGVDKDHTIKVVSKADVGSGGSGPGSGGGTDTDGGNGNGSAGNGGDGTGTGGNGGNGTGTTGSGNGNGDGQWAVLNLVCAILAVLTGLVGLIAGRDRLRTNNEEKRSKSALTFRVIALIIGIVSVIVFFLTENWSLPVAPVDGWTLLMFIMFLATLILAMVSFRFDEGPEERQ